MTVSTPCDLCRVYIPETGLERVTVREYSDEMQWVDICPVCLSNPTAHAEGVDPDIIDAVAGYTFD